MELMQANAQWRSRPDDERFLSLDDLHEHNCNVMNHSKALTVSSRSIKFEPAPDNKGLIIVGETNSFSPTNWAFGQLCNLAGAPSGYLREHLPSPLVADCLNWDFGVNRKVQDVGVLLYQNGGPPMMTAATGPDYGRIWNAEYSRQLRDLVGNGVDGRWHIPSEFNVRSPITKENTTIYAGDRDMWLFLCDGGSDVELPNRRHGQTGHLQRGFFAWNSDVGARTFGIATFIFDYMCGNHIIWNVSGFNEIRLRHTSSAPDKWMHELVPALKSYANSETTNILETLKAAQASKIGDTEKVAEFLATRFGSRMVERLVAQHQLEEQRPIETVFDAVTAATAVARSIPYVGDRVDLERTAGKLLELVAA